MLATQRGLNLSVIQVLLEKKANPNITDKVGLCLHVWIMYHCSLCVQTTGRSAIFFAVEKGQLEIAKLLVSGGADVDLKDKVDW